MRLFEALAFLIVICFRVSQSSDDDNDVDSNSSEEFDSNETSNYTFTSKIVGGTAAPEEYSRFQISLFNKKYRHFCGGAIISQNWIVTSAHCKPVCDDGLLCAVRYATYKLREGRVAPIRLFVTHEHFTKYPFLDFDVAVAEAPLILDTLAQPIQIYPNEIPYQGEMVVIGWGWVKAQVGTCSTTLKMTKLQRVKCPITISDNFVCTHGIDSNPCHGDSGGSLLYGGYLAGLVGAGAKQAAKKSARSLNMQTRCHSGTIINYTKLSRFILWIQNSIQYHSAAFHLGTLDNFVQWTPEYVKKLYIYPNTPNEC